MMGRPIRLVEGVAVALPRRYFRLHIQHEGGAAELRARGEFDMLLALYQQLDRLGYRLVSLVPETEL